MPGVAAAAWALVTLLVASGLSGCEGGGVLGAYNIVAESTVLQRINSRFAPDAPVQQGLTRDASGEFPVSFCDLALSTTRFRGGQVDIDWQGCLTGFSQHWIGTLDGRGDGTYAGWVDIDLIPGGQTYPVWVRFERRPVSGSTSR